MRVIAGEFRSRVLKSVPGEATRPTSDRLRETLFNILQARIQGATFLDAYAGTGAVGIEALSRGARHVWFLERDPVALQAIRENVASLRVERRCTVVAGAVLKTLAQALAQQKAEIVFLDPPYPLESEYASSLDLLGGTETELVVVQHSVRFAPAERYGSLERTRVVKQGDNALAFFTRVTAPPEEP